MPPGEVWSTRLLLPLPDWKTVAVTVSPSWTMSDVLPSPLWSTRASSSVPVWLTDDRLLLPLCVTRSEEHTSELQSLMRNSYAVFCLKKQKNKASEHE